MDYRKIILVILILLSALGIHAQSSLQYPWYINMNGGVSQLYGDIQNHDNPFDKFDNETGIGFGLRAGRQITPIFYGHLQLGNFGLDRKSVV